MFVDDGIVHKNLRALFIYCLRSTTYYRPLYRQLCGWMMKQIVCELTLLVVLLAPACWAQGKYNCVSIHGVFGCTVQTVVCALLLEHT